MKNYDRIHEHLAQQIEPLVKRLFPHCLIQRYGNQLRIGRRGSLSVMIRGPKAGLWHSFEEDCSGNMIGLIQYVYGFSFKDAVQWAENYLGFSGEDAPPPPVHRIPKRIPSCDAIKQRRIAKALHIWEHSTAIEGTLGHKYLKSRNLRLDAPLNAVRFHPKLTYALNPIWQFPAVVCATTNIEGTLTGVHAVYLDPETAAKAPLPDRKPAKLSIGVMKGSAVKLATHSRKLVITEGVEDALTILQCCPEYSVWAGIGGSMASLEIPNDIHEIVIASDADDAGQQLARKLANRIQQSGRQVRIAIPSHGKDFNAMLMEHAQ